MKKSSLINTGIKILASAVCILMLSACQVTQALSAMLATDTPTPTMTFTPTATATFTLTPTMTLTFTPTATATATTTLTATATRTLIPTARPTQKPTSVNGGSGTCNGGNSSYESQVVSLINKERANAGVSALSNNGKLAAAARAHSQDMANNNYFSHTGSDGSSPFDRMAAHGYSYSAAAENIYAGDGGNNNPYSAVSAWMDSQGHRDNLLNGTYTNIGVGYWCNPNSDYQGYFTADFGRP
jgi:uncharacterized protein YkwD